MENESTALQAQEQEMNVQGTQAAPVATMWNDDAMLKRAYRAAGYLASTDLVPDTYRNKPANCLIALDAANRTGMSPLTVMQSLYIVKGKPVWSGQFCAAAINGCGKFTPLEFVFSGTPGEPDFGCTARAVRKATGATCVSETITLQMARDEGWLDKAGSKWKTMPRQMAMYRAAAFFARAYCPEVLLGMQTAEEVRDVQGYDEGRTTIIKIEGGEDGHASENA